MKDKLGLIEKISTPLKDCYELQPIVRGDNRGKFIKIFHCDAFQELGSLYFKKHDNETLEDLIPNLKSELFAYSYEKIWEELTEADRFLVRLLTEKDEYKREEVLLLMGEKAGSYSMYRDRLLKKGILESRQSYISFSLPFFADYVKDYCS